MTSVPGVVIYIDSRKSCGSRKRRVELVVREDDNPENSQVCLGVNSCGFGGPRQYFLNK